MKEVNQEAIILVGHGSRVPGAGEGMEKVAEGLRQKLHHSIIEICYLSRLGPHFPEVLEKCVAQGATKVLVLPYFLHAGLHLLLDIPQMMQEKAREFPQVKLILGKNLGFDESLVELVTKRIEESRELGDVRDLKLERIERTI